VAGPGELHLVATVGHRGLLLAHQGLGPGHQCDGSNNLAVEHSCDQPVDTAGWPG
jgi:hypothetical protein